MIIAERGITYSSSINSAIISIPDRVENNNTMLSCAGFLFGGTEFSEPIMLIIIGESVMIDCYELQTMFYYVSLIIV